MKIIQIDDRFEICDDGMRTHDRLPPQTYVVRFADMHGFYLERHAPLAVTEKIYGDHSRKVEKVLAAFARTDRNLGVILSGRKGIGKSVFARMLGDRAVERGLPVLIIEKYVPGIAAYIESIDQEAMVLFDEFDKTFVKIGTDDDTTPQTSLLSLFDGLASGKKLFVVTCNEIFLLSDYLVNRPGRFHYHFRFEYPGDTEIREYLQDKLDRKYWPEIDAVVEFSHRVDLNYDCLRAIAFELSTGSPFAESIKDMNIVNMDEAEYDLALRFDDGTVLTRKRCEMNLFGQDAPEEFWLRNSRGYYAAKVAFVPSECVFDPAHGCLVLNGGSLEITEYDDKHEDEAAALRKAKPLYLSVTQNRGRDIHYAV